MHDHVFTLINGRVYSSGAFPSWSWLRYLECFSSVTVVARVRQLDAAPKEIKIDLSECDGVNFIFLPSVSNLKGLVSHGGESGKELQEIVQQHDAVVARLSSELGLLAVSYAKKLEKRLAVELVDCPWDSYWNYGSWLARLYAPLVTYRVRRAVAKADAVLYVTERFLQRRYPHGKNSATVACSNVNIESVDDSVLEQRIQRISRRKDVISHAPIIGQVASLTGKFKGLQVMLDVMPTLVSLFPGIKYKVLGAGDPSEWIEKAKALGVSDNVEFSGTRPSGQPVMEWLDDLDIYIHPSLKEGLPRGVIEAMSRGCPVIASSVAGTPELLPSKYMVEPGSREDLLEKIQSVISNPSLFSVMATENFERAKSFSAPKLKAKRSQFWRNFAGQVNENSISG